VRIEWGGHASNIEGGLEFGQTHGQLACEQGTGRTIQGGALSGMKKVLREESYARASPKPSGARGGGGQHTKVVKKRDERMS